ncbi:MAG: von Willebrand factor type A domain-containing protein [Anaerolineae bacterium]|nr:von Willebrand factor type A domain-containing protein [Anaerolineae bacterium]
MLRRFHMSTPPRSSRLRWIIAVMIVFTFACAPAGMAPSPAGESNRAPAATPIAPAKELAAGPSVSVGGTTPPNAEPYDATFFKTYGVNPFIDTEDEHLSTFGMDVDTASYTIVRRYITDGNLPPAEAIRVEEFVNYFKHDYPEPEEGAFAIRLDAAPAPFRGERYRLLRIGVQGRHIPAEDREDATLIFVIDVSGSMARENRLGLVKRALRLLLDELRPTDDVGIVVYGSQARVVLQPTPASDRSAIIAAIESLRSGGSTNAEEGLRLGYQMATRSLEEERGPRITHLILCSDGVANVGRTGAEGILKEVQDYVANGITLSTVGFGMGNYNDVLMEQLADKGNGSYAYVDTLTEARRIFVENLTGTLQLIARDAKVQVDFNPEVVSRFRLLGYENRRLKAEEFRDDTVDAGEVGAGHSVTALYEFKLHDGAEGRVATVFIRYQDPDTGEVTEIQQSLGTSDILPTFEEAPLSFQLDAAVAEFAEVLRKSYWAQNTRLRDVLALAQRVSAAMPDDADVTELVYLISQANRLMAQE